MIGLLFCLGLLIAALKDLIFPYSVKVTRLPLCLAVCSINHLIMFSCTGSTKCG